MLRAAVLAFALVSAPAFASHFHADPAVRPAKDKLVLRDTVWICGEDGCAAAASNSRPAIVCAVLARHVGALRGFSAGGAALAPDALEKCNARAR